MFTTHFSKNRQFALAVILGLITGYISNPALFAVAGVVSEIFMNLLKLVSLPIIFLSIVSTACGMESVTEVKSLGKKVITYTLLTTVIAAAVALLLFVVVNPVGSPEIASESVAIISQNQPSYLSYLLQTIPSNIIKPFNENNAVGVLLLAILLSVSILSLPNHNRKTLHSVFSSLYAAIMKITIWIVQFMPIAIWAFLSLFIKDFQQGLELKSLALYLFCVVAANCIQGLVVLPVFLKLKGISPWALAKAMTPSLWVAFFTKSSAAALPTAIRCAEENAGISPKVAHFSFPLCTSINMNGCAAFILTTVLFVGMSQGLTFSGVEMVGWVFIATIAAVGNAGVPMGCYFLSGALLASMNVPLNILGVILPFYTFIDMLETALNVWSDSCVTAVVNKELTVEEVDELLPEGAEVSESPRVTRCC